MSADLCFRVEVSLMPSGQALHIKEPGCWRQDQHNYTQYRGAGIRIMGLEDVAYNSLLFLCSVLCSL